MLLHPSSLTSRSSESNLSKSGYYCSSQTHMDNDRCIWRRMFVFHQPLPYQVTSTNSLKQMETRRDVWLPKGMRNAESTSSTNFVFFQRRMLWKVDSVSCKLRVSFSAGKGEAGVRTEARPKMSSYVNLSVQHLSR